MKLVLIKTLYPSILSCLLLLTFKATIAQNPGKPPGKNTNPPAPARRSAVIQSLNQDSLIEERLVALALKGPQYQISDHQNKIAERQLSSTRKSWLNLLSISANYNDQTFAKQNTQSTYVYPKYFFGLNIPLGLIFGMGPQIKIARESLAVSQSTQEQLARTIRADVLSKYKQYKTYASLIALQNTIVVDEQVALSQTEKKFKDGSIPMEAYNSSNKAFSDDVAKKLNLQLQQDLIKIDLEKVIGTRLENVIN